MKILITGGAGLIGQAIAKKHLAEGDEVFIWDDRSNPYNNYDNILGVDIYSQYKTFTLKNPLILKHTLSDIKPDIISNQAALVSVGESQYKIYEFMQNNIEATSFLLQTILDLKVETGYVPKKIIHAGSMGPYGDNYFKDEFMSETDELNPSSIYGVSKMAQEEMIRVFAETYDVHSVSLRYFSVYGTEQNPINPYTGVLSVIANQCLNSDKIYINEDGEQTRDLIHVDDVANIHFLESRQTRFFSFVYYNVGTANSYSLKYIAEKMRNILSPEKEIIYTNKYRKGDIKYSLASTMLLDLYYPELKFKRLNDSIIEYCDYIEKHRKEFTIEKNTIKSANDNLDKYGLFYEEEKC